VALRHAGVVYQHETDLEVAHTHHSMYMTSTPRLTHSQVHAIQSTAALNASGIVPGSQGIDVPGGEAHVEGSGSQHALSHIHLVCDMLVVEELTRHSQATQMPSVALDRNILPDEASNSGHACMLIAAIKQGPACEREALPYGERATLPPIEDADRPTRG
jgi:hypothetical protein